MIKAINEINFSGTNKQITMIRVYKAAVSHTSREEMRITNMAKEVYIYIHKYSMCDFHHRKRLEHQLRFW